MSTVDVTPVRLQEPVVAGGIRSVNFFNGRLLAGEDLTAEQQTQRAERLALGQGLGEGVAYGLEAYEDLAKSRRSSPVLTVEPGLAVSAAGQTLVLEQRIDVSLVRDAVATGDSAGGGLFADCLTSTPGTFTSGAGVYVLTIGPASKPQGRAPVSGQATGGAPCAVDASLEGVQFRLVCVPGLDAEELGASFRPRLRNHVAHRMFGTADPARIAFRVNPFGDRVTSYGLLDVMRGEGLLTDAEVPIATLAWTDATGVQYVDLWSVRRRLNRRAESERVPERLPGRAALARPTLVGERARAEAEAIYLQFESEIEELRPFGGLEHVAAVDVFDYLPPVGLLPVRRTGSPVGFDPDVFFGAQGSRDGATIDAALVPALVRAAIFDEPIAVDGREQVQVYLVWESELAVQAGASRQAAVLFAKSTLPYRGTLRYGYARFGAGRASRW